MTRNVKIGLIVCFNFLYGAFCMKNACPVAALYHVAAFSHQCHYNPDVLSDVPSMCKRHGYSLQTFSTTTKDGYIINVFRIGSERFNATKSPVFVQHGIAINSGSWVDIRNRSLAFALVEEGYDVWIGNLRGSLYSNKHTNLTVRDPLYWKFNLDTQADNDIRNQINLVFEKTGKKIIYIGHSMGTTLSFMYAANHSEEASNRLKAIIALAPIAYLDGVVILKLLAPVLIPVADILTTLQIKGVLYEEDTIHAIFTNTCLLLPEICLLLYSTISGISKQYPAEDLLLFSSYWPSGTSIYQLKHYLQIVNSEKFQRFDYGKKINLEIYKEDQPPTYNLTNIKVPICLLYGKNDILYSKENVERLYREIGTSSKCKYSIPFNGTGIDNFSHIDFVYSKFLVKYLYNGLFELLNSYQ